MPVWPYYWPSTVSEASAASVVAAGSVAAHLRALGFDNVYNRNEDFYAVIGLIG